MKKLFLSILCFCLLFVSGCSKSEQNVPVAEQQASANNVNIQVASELEKIENINELDNETIKALSVIVRTNLINENQSNQTEPQNEYNVSNQHILELVNQTNGEILSNEDNEVFEKIYIVDAKDEQSWFREIKKVDILNYLKENNISLSSLSNIETEIDDNGRTIMLRLGGKEFDIKELMKRFDIPSNNIINIENKLSSITIEGKGNGTGQNFDISEAENYAKEGQNYKKILKNRYNNFNIITNG